MTNLSHTASFHSKERIAPSNRGIKQLALVRHLRGPDLLALILALAATAPSDTDMLAHFKAGKLLCSNPDAQTKTCSTIDKLVVRPDGTLVDTGETLVAPDKPVTLETTSVVHMDSGAMCGVMDMADLQRGIVRANGVPLPPDRNATVIDKLSAVFKPLSGQKVCEGLRVDHGHLIKVGQAERVDLPLPGKPVAWIDADGGYRVAPRTGGTEP
jgi:hypothetical protein